MINVSQTAIDAVIRDMESGNTAYVEEFFAVRPDWKDQQEKMTEQADNSQKAAEKERS